MRQNQNKWIPSNSEPPIYIQIYFAYLSDLYTN